MPEKLIWSWTPEDNRKFTPSNDLPKWVEKFAEIAAICVSLSVLYFMLSPIIAPTLLFPVISLIVSLSYLIVSTKRRKKSLKNEAYLKIFTSGISVNLEDLNGFYKSDNINIETLKIKKISHSTGINNCKVKGLCFETHMPKTKIKIPLFRIINENIYDLEAMITQLKIVNT